MLKKISPDTNVLTWFEIPVADMQRARTFYETVLDLKMETMDQGNTEEETVFFPRKPNTIMAQSGILSGALVKAKRLTPGSNGPLIYLNATPSIDKAIERIEKAGGKLVSPKSKIPAGLIAVFTDSEGNTPALHAAE